MKSLKSAQTAAQVLGFVAMLAAATSALAQDTATVQGVVTDSATQEPIENAQVTAVGTNVGAVTRNDGRYVLRNLGSGTRTIRVQLIGYAPSEQTVTLAAGESRVVNFALRRTAFELSEVVVVGYGTQSRRELSSAVSSINSERIENVPVASLDAALQGNVAGVQVTQNAGNPGNGIAVQVRGLASVSASNQPLYVIDGVPMLSEDYSQLDLGGQSINSVTNISPNEIESIDILKDAAATAIYGSRGSNGVVVITTKRGQAGRPQVTFNAYTGVQEASDRLDLMNATQYLEFFDEAAANDGYGERYVSDSVYEGVTPINTDWQEEVLRSAQVSSIELGVSGGSERVRYRLTGTYFDQGGIVIGSSYDRVNGRANVDFDVSERLSISTSLGLSHEDSRRIENDGSSQGIITNAVGNQPIFPPREPDGDFLGTDAGLQYPNAVALGTLNSADTRTFRALGTVEARLGLFGPLRFTSKLGFDVYNLREDQYESPRIIGTYAASNGGVSKRGYSTANRYLVDNYFTYENVLGDRHDLSVTAGASLEFQDVDDNFLRGEALGSDRLTQVGNAATIAEYDGAFSENNLVSFFSRANYSLSDRYLLSASLRTDGSSRFGENNRFGVFPAVSVGWVMSEEPFMRDVGFISQLKLRTSYGLTGNQAIIDYPYQGLAASANYEDTPGLAPSNIENPDLKWETTRQFDVGFDLLMFGERLGIAADYYHKETSDLLLDRPISCTSGFCSVFDNVGNVENKGFEFALNTVNIESGSPNGFRWTTNLNISVNRNEVTELAGDQPFSVGIRDINRVQVGEPIGAFYTLKFLGVDPQTGDAIFENLDTIPAITPADFQIVGSPHPDYTGGLTNNFSFKGFDASVMFQFSQGNEIFNAMRVFSDAGGFYYDNHYEDVLERWQQPGDVTDVPRASFDGNSGSEIISSRFIEDGSYVRLQEITLGYRLPSSVLGFTRLQSARIFVSGRNLHTWTDFTGYSPEANSNGLQYSTETSAELGTDFYSYPLARTWSVGIQGAW